MYNLQLIQEITPLKSWDRKLDHFINMSPFLRKSAEHYKAYGVSLMARINAISVFEWKYKNIIKSHTVLVRPDGVRLNTDKDYGLSKVGVIYQEVHQILLFYIQYLMDAATVVVLLYWHNTSADVVTVVVVLQYVHNTLADVATVVILLQYLHNTSADLATIVVLQYLHSTSTMLLV
jgi:hypothetical protein